MLNRFARFTVGSIKIYIFQLKFSRFLYDSRLNVDVHRSDWPLTSADSPRRGSGEQELVLGL